MPFFLCLMWGWISSSKHRACSPYRILQGSMPGVTWHPEVSWCRSPQSSHYALVRGQ